MDKFLSIIPILGGLLGLTVSIQSFSKHVRETGVMQSILILSSICLPVLFIQQIIIIANNMHLAIVQALDMVIGVALLGITIYRIF